MPIMLTPEQIRVEVQTWVYRCKVGAVTAGAAFVAWIVTAQVLRGTVFPATWYMLSADNVALTGW